MIRKFGGASGIDSQPTGLDIGVGGMEIQGIVEEYIAQAGSIISTGDFVEFIKSVDIGTETQITTPNTSWLSAIAITDTTILVAYYETYGKAVILTISGTTITVGTPVVFNSAQTSKISLEKLTDISALVVYADDGNSSYGTAQVLTISGNTITIGTEFAFNSVSTSAISAVALSATSVLVAYGTSGLGPTVILTISGTTISSGTVKYFSSYSTPYVKAVMLSATKVLVVYAHMTTEARVVILTISGTTITVGTYLQIYPSTIYEISVVALTESSVFVVYRGYGVALTCGVAQLLLINGTAISVNADIVFTQADMYQPNVVEISNKSVSISYTNGDNLSYGESLIIDISDKLLKIHNVTIFSSATTTQISQILRANGSIVTYYRSGTGSKVRIMTPLTNIANCSDKMRINGVAKTKGVAGESVKTYTLA